MTCARVTCRLIIVACSVVWVGCDFGDGFDGLSRLGCAFDFDFNHSIESDHGLLEADVRCGAGDDCADRRTVIKGSSFDVAIEVPSRELRGVPTATASGDQLEIDGFEAQADPCGGYRLVGTAHYDDVGTAALVVSDDEREIDRFTVTVHEPDHLDLQARPGIDFGAAGGYTSYAQGDTLSIDDVHSVRVFVRNAAGERLVGATALAWEIEDESVARRHYGLLVPQAIGTTTLRARGAGLAVELKLEVTGVNEEFLDGGLGDAESED